MIRPANLQGSPIELHLLCNETEVARSETLVADTQSIQSKPSLQSKRAGPEKAVRPVKSTRRVTMTQLKWPRWALKNASVFDNDEEESSAANLLGPGWEPYGFRNSSFFQWGIRYIPSPSDDDVYRTVRIDQLPCSISLDQILSRVRGGQVYSATLCDTVSLTGYPTTLVTFVRQQGALTFLRRVAQEGFFVGLNPAAVHPVPTPTYIINETMQKQINEFGRTRCLLVTSSRPRLKKDLHRVLARSTCRNHVECFGERDDPGETTIRFSSIKIALVAYDLLNGRAKLPGCIVQFGQDPCADE